MKEIKEMSLWTNCIYYGGESDTYYSDKLRVSKNWVSYSRKGFSKKELDCEWSYKNSSMSLISKFDNLCFAIENCLHNKKDTLVVTDCGCFSIRVTFIDNTHVTIKYDADFAANKLYELARCFKCFIPQGFEYSEMLDNKDPLGINPNILEEAIRTLRTSSKVDMVASKNSPNMLIMCYPQYPSCIDILFDTLEKDFHCHEKISRVLGSGILPNKYSLDQIQTYLTFIYENEKFADGFIAKEIENGTLLKVLERFAELK